MKQFLITVLTAIIAVTIAIVAYEKWIVAPRIERERDVTTSRIAQLKAEAQLLRDTALRDLSLAKAASAELNKTVESAAGAQQALDAKFAESTLRNQLASAIASAGALKAAVAEFAQAEGRLPNSRAEIGADKPEMYARDSVKSISIGAKGVITISLVDAIEANAKIQLSPMQSGVGGAITWKCKAQLKADLRALLPNC
jgi:Pilin (bacterial filament)